MKRIAENVALQTVLYVIGGLEDIRIIDYKNDYEASHFCDMWGHCGRYTEVYCGKKKDMNYDTLNYWQERSKVRSLESIGDVLQIGICTEADTY